MIMVAMIIIDVSLEDQRFQEHPRGIEGKNEWIYCVCGKNSELWIVRIAESNNML